LSPGSARRTSAAVTRDLFDRHLRALRRDRAARIGPELFLLDRAFDECIDRLRDIARPFGRALLVGCPSARWAGRLGAIADEVDIVDPGQLFVEQVDGILAEEDRFDFGEQRYDLCVAVGTLDTVNDLPLALQLLRRSLKPDAPLIGAIAGGNSLPALRASLIEAGRAQGRVVARAHPRIEAQSLTQLLAASGLTMPVVDVDRVRIRYADLHSLIRDLRAMAATAVLSERPPPLSRAAANRARSAFAGLGSGGRTEEIVEILHFIAWSPPLRQAAG
jgi:NADH dehydrogenase [ubiquinone] 1 alpha subcomplex assembly factor 5